MPSLIHRIGYIPAQICHPAPDEPFSVQSWVDPTFGDSPPNNGQNQNQSAGAARHGGGVGKPPYINGPQMTRKPGGTER